MLSAEKLLPLIQLVISNVTRVSVGTYAPNNTLTVNIWIEGATDPLQTIAMVVRGEVVFHPELIELTSKSAAEVT